MVIAFRDFAISMDTRTVGVVALSLFIISPVIALLVISTGDSHGIWLHLIHSVLGKYLINTATLMVGVAVVSLVFGISTAWIISSYRFRFSRWFDVVMLLPMACPAYLVAYAYTDFFEYAGPAQGALRAFMGWRSANDYYFPEIRSMGGAIFVLSSVLYPYVYLLTRTAFQNISSSFYEVAALSNRNVFWNVSLPLARPAIVAGLALVLMEVISDFGTVEFFAIETLTLGIFNVWIGMNSITGAAQIATITFAFVILLIVLEFYARGERRFSNIGGRQANTTLVDVHGKQAFMLGLICLVPVGFGFLVPVSILATNVLTSADLVAFVGVWRVFSNSVFVSFIGAFIIMGSAVWIGSSAKMSGNKIVQIIGKLSATGYAFPGTMLAIGVLTCLSFADDFLYWSPIYFSGTMFALFFAYLVRFHAVGYGSVSSGLTRVPENLISCSRSLGLSPQLTTIRVTIPLVRNAIFAGFVLAFVDITKELPMTLLLRPFDFETLATYAYQYAHSELMDQASLPALIIISVGLVPVVFLNHVMQKRKSL